MHINVLWVNNIYTEYGIKLGKAERTNNQNNKTKREREKKKNNKQQQRVGHIQLHTLVLGITFDSENFYV